MMKKDRQFLERLADGMDLPGEPLPGYPLVEISGERRVLIENHYGITQYSHEQICVKVKYGHISVCGGCLELIRMTREQLIIAGRIDQVRLIRRER